MNRDDGRRVALVSPMECSFLVDLNDRAHNTSGKAEDFYAVQIMESGKEFRDFYKDFCTEMGLNFEKDTDILKSIILNAIFQNLTMISDILDCPKRISMI